VKSKREQRRNQDLVSEVKADLLLRKINHNFDERFKHKIPQELAWRTHRTAQEAATRTAADGHKTPERPPPEKPVPVRSTLKFADLVDQNSSSPKKPSDVCQQFDPSRVVVTKPIIQGQIFFEGLDKPLESQAVLSGHKHPSREAKRRLDWSSSKPTALLDNPKEGAHPSHQFPSEDITFRPPNYQASENSLKSVGWYSTYLHVMNEHHSTPSKFKRQVDRPVRDSIEEASTLNRYERPSRKESNGTEIEQAKGSPARQPPNQKDSSEAHQVNLEDICSKTQSLKNERGMSFFGEPRTLDWSGQAVPDDRRLNETRITQSKTTNLFLMAGKQEPPAPHGTRSSLSDLAPKHQVPQKAFLNSSLKDYRIQEPDLKSFDAKASPRIHESLPVANVMLKHTFKNIDLFASLEDFPPADKQNPSQATNAESSLPIDFFNTFNSKDIQFLREPISNKPVSTKKILYDFESLDCFSKNKPQDLANHSSKPTAPTEPEHKKLSPQRIPAAHSPKPHHLNPKPQTTTKPQPSPPHKPTKSQTPFSPPKSRLKTPLKTIKNSK